MEKWLQKFERACQAFLWVLRGDAVMINVKVKIHGSLEFPEDRKVLITNCMFEGKTNDAMLKFNWPYTEGM